MQLFDAQNSKKRKTKKKKKESKKIQFTTLRNITKHFGKLMIATRPHKRSNEMQVERRLQKL